MQFKAVVLAALAAAASAQSNDLVPESVKASVLNVLVTALPPSVLAAAATNQPAFISDIAKSISASQTPDWYKPLPTDVKTLLTKIYPVNTPAATVSSSSSSSSSASVATTSATTSAPVTASTGALSSPGLNSTSITSINTPTLSSTSGAPSSRPSNTAPASNGAVYPAAAIGSSMAAVFGVLGLLLL